MNATSPYLDLLRQSFPTNTQAALEIAHLENKLNLPKPTELFVSDIHGEYEAFSHILRNGCGALHDAIESALTGLTSEDKAELLMLVCYPEEKFPAALAKASNDLAWFETTLTHLLILLQEAGKAHPWEDVQATIPAPYRTYIESLLHRLTGNTLSIEPQALEILVQTNVGRTLVQTICTAIKQLLVDKLHMLGDVYDRGPAPELIMEELMGFPHIDIQWGNHDIVWMGAALGQRGCIAHVVRNCARYGNLSILSDAYGINLLDLATFALDAYRNDPCVGYGLKGNSDLSAEETELNIKIQKAMAILQFKVEAQLIDENPSFGLEDRKLLHRINRETNTIVIDGVEYEITDPVFPTVDFSNPYQLTEAEEKVMQSLEQAFTTCEKLQRHIQFFLEKGSLYRIENNILMFHACVPLNEDGSLKEVNLFGNTFKGKSLFDEVDRQVRLAFLATDAKEKKRGCDLLWYLWLGEGSPLFAKSKMATFEIYLIAEKEARKEVKNSFYSLLDNKEVFAEIFKDFGLDPAVSHIVCGHTPVKVKDGEDPLKGDGQVIIIDGGFSSAYQKTTGIAGFTLISDSTGIRLASHEPFTRTAALKNNEDIATTLRVVENYEKSRTVADSDAGAGIKDRIAALHELIEEEGVLNSMTE